MFAIATYSRRAGLVALAALCHFGLPLSPPTSAWAQTPSLASPDVWSQPTLTGDWQGVRPNLERRGISFSLNYATEVLANVRGGIRRGAVGNGLFQPQIDVDLAKLWGWQGGMFRASGIVTHGPGLTPGYVGNLMTISNIEAGPVARMYELWYEQSALDDRFSVRTGLMTADDFMSSESASTFLNNTFGWNTLFSYALPAGGPSYPIPAPAVRVGIKPASDVYFQAAVFSGDPSGGNGSNQGAELPRGTVFSFRGGAFLITEIGYTPNQEKNATGLPASYKLGAWYHSSSRFGDQRVDTLGRSLADPTSNGVPFDHTGNWALYAVVDQMLFRVPGAEDQGLSGFVRVTGAPTYRNLVDFYIDGGLVYTGLIPGRPNDKFGVAAAYAKISNRARDLDRDTGFFENSPYPMRRAETGIEITYRAKLAPWWTLQGDLQYIIRPGGGVLNDDGSYRQNAWVVGLRSILNL